MISTKRLNKIQTVAGKRQQGIIVFEDIHDPHNAAAVLRTADAFGIQKVYFIQHHFSQTKNNKNSKSVQQTQTIRKILSDKSGAGFMFEKGTVFNPKKVGKASSSSANKWLDFEVFNSTEDCMEELNKKGYHIVATVLDDKAKSIFKTKFTHNKIALCFGNEHTGLSETAIKLSHSHVYIPMQGFVQSLNLSVTAAICLYEVFRQRKLKKQFLLPAKEKQKLINAWVKK